MATIARTADAYKSYLDSSYFQADRRWDAWADTTDATTRRAESEIGTSIPKDRALAFRYPGGVPGALSSFSCSITIENSGVYGGSEDAELICQLFTADVFGNQARPEELSSQAISTQTVRVTSLETGLKTITFSNLSLDNSQTLYCMLWVRLNTYTGGQDGAWVGFTTISNSSANVTVPSLAISITPSTVVLGNSIKIDFTNRIEQSLTLTYRSGSTVLGTDTVTSDTFYKTAPASWFETAGQTGNSLSVSISASDQYGRTASGSFSVQKPQALTVSATAPKSTTKEGSESIQFAWSVSGTWGTQTKAELQYSTDNVNWNSLATVNSSSTTTSIPSKTLPPGTIYWRVRVYSTYSVWSNWSSSATFTVAYAATSYIEPMNSPTGGNVDATLAQVFGISMLANGIPYTPFTVSSAVLHWRSRASDPWTDVSMTPNETTASVTIPANTFPAGDMYWYASAVDQYGSESQTAVYTVSTLASSIDAQPILPNKTIESKSKPTSFKWRYATITGSEQAAAELEYSTDGNAWLPIGSVNGSATTFVAAANAIPSGTIYWRVRAENAEGAWGPWSDPASYINLGASDVLSVQTDAKPYATIVWQTDEQEAYRITVDGAQVVQAYGADVRKYKLTEFLADGVHTVSVEAQNKYGLWSPPKETSFVVTNAPGDPVELSGRFDRDAELQWETASQTADFVIYRDGARIGHTSGNTFMDRVVLGWHTWQVINRLPGGYYTASNMVSGTLCTAVMALAPLAGGAWMDLELSENAVRSTTAIQGQTVHLRQFAGQEYPDAEVAPYKTMGISFDVAFPTAQRAQARDFEAMLGRAVIFKEPGEEAIVGVLSGYQRRHTCEARSYTATLQRIHWRDYVDEES